MRVNTSNISNDELGHCHLSAAPLQGSSTAWQQLIAATLLCLLFMVGDRQMNSLDQDPVKQVVNGTSQGRSHSDNTQEYTVVKKHF